MLQSMGLQRVGHDLVSEQQPHVPPLPNLTHHFSLPTIKSEICPFGLTPPFVIVLLFTYFNFWWGTLALQSGISFYCFLKASLFPKMLVTKVISDIVFSFLIMIKYI